MPRKARKPLSEAEIDQLMLLARGNAMACQLRAERAAAPTSRHLACHRAGDATLKILMISDVYFPRVNGVSTSVASFRDALERLGHTVVVLCPDYPVGQVEEPGVLRIASRGVPGDPEDRMMRLGELLALGPELEEAGFDLIHVQTPFVAHVAGIRLGRRLGIPVVASYHTLFEEYLHHYVRWLPRRLLRFLARRLAVHQCRQLDALVTPSHAMREALLRYGVTAPMTVIPTGLALESFAQPAEACDFRSRYDLPANARLLLYVGRTAFEKNIGFLIEVLPRVLADDTLRRRLAKRGRIHAAGWHEDAKAAELVMLYSGAEPLCTGIAGQGGSLPSPTAPGLSERGRLPLRFRPATRDWPGRPLPPRSESAS
ncbi:glycosyltransferase [uncultured Halomonas sp.]|uniref:glycosyltransferase n=1 Tax=uncultured Halomonas sp. TaxID=173971 RepID=UPI0026186CBB|nr:glycosyltransferase [uncultured Halomonas sp.]